MSMFFKTMSKCKAVPFDDDADTNFSVELGKTKPEDVDYCNKTCTCYITC